MHRAQFAAHADFIETSGFVRLLQPKCRIFRTLVRTNSYRHLILVHGAKKEMEDLKQKLLIEHAGNISIYTPATADGDIVELKFNTQKVRLMYNVWCLHGV